METPEEKPDKNLRVLSVEDPFDFPQIIPTAYINVYEGLTDIIEETKYFPKSQSKYHK